MSGISRVAQQPPTAAMTSLAGCLRRTALSHHPPAAGPEALLFRRARIAPKTLAGYLERGTFDIGCRRRAGG